MSEAFDRISRGLNEAIAIARGEGDTTTCRVHVPAQIDVRAIRNRLNMTQQEFAGRFGFSINTLRHWEQGVGQPEGEARAYLRVIEKAPDMVQQALQPDP